MVPTSVLCLERVPWYAYGGLHGDTVQTELVPIVYDVQNAGEEFADHALIPSSKVVLGAEFSFKKRATAVVKLRSCELLAPADLLAKLCGESSR